MQTKVRESYLDPNRDQIDPGSYQRVNRYETDLNGVRWHITGTQWTSSGVPHGNLSRRRVVSGGGGIVEDRNEHVAFGVPSSGNSGASKSNAPKPRNGSNPPRYQSGKPKTSPFDHALVKAAACDPQTQSLQPLLSSCRENEISLLQEIVTRRDSFELASFLNRGAMPFASLGRKSWGFRPILAFPPPCDRPHRGRSQGGGTVYYLATTWDLRPRLSHCVPPALKCVTSRRVSEGLTANSSLSHRGTEQIQFLLAARALTRAECRQSRKRFPRSFPARMIGWQSEVASVGATDRSNLPKGFAIMFRRTSFLTIATFTVVWAV